MNFYKKNMFIALMSIINIILMSNALVSAELEIRDYQGKHFDSFDRDYDNSIKGPQTIDIKKYRLDVTGLIKYPQSLTYEQVQKLPIVKRTITLHCVEGWSEHLLFEGFRLSELLSLTKPGEGVNTVIFYAADGYSSSLSYKDIIRLDLILAYRINGKTLDAKRGFPFQLVAESKLGYKWVKWITKIELSKESYKGYWEQRGYNNDADVNR
jgi:DMSO/TMAO reductase YedYZ molybdopterin-dependent catalytic subunit